MPRRRSARKTPAKKSTAAKKVVEKNDAVRASEEEDEITTLDETSNMESSKIEENSVDDSKNGMNDNDDDSSSKVQVEMNDDDDDDHSNSNSNEVKNGEQNTNDTNVDDGDGDMDSKDEAKDEDETTPGNDDSTNNNNKDVSKRDGKRQLNSEHNSNGNGSSDGGGNRKSKNSSSQSKKSESHHHQHNKKSRYSSESESKSKPDHHKKDKDYDESYFKRMHHRSQDKFHDPTDKELFIENLLNNIKDQDIMKLCEHRHPSACITFLLENMDNMSSLKKLIEKVNPEQFSMDFVTQEESRAVVESIIDILMNKLTKDEDFESENNKWMVKWLDSAAKFLIDNLDSFMTDATDQGNNFLILMLEVLGGIRIGRYWNRKNMRLGGGQKLDLATIISSDKAFKEIPQSFKHHLKKITKALVLDADDDVIREKMFRECHNVAQYLLFILRIRYPELCQMAVKKLVEVVFADDESRDSICHQTNGAYIVEIILLVSSESRLSKIWTKHLKSHLQMFWKHDISQFIIQRLIDAIKEENLYSDVLQDLFPDLGEIFKCNRPGIGVVLTKTCKNFPKMQMPLTVAIMKAFDCYEPKDKQIETVPQMLFFESKYQKPNRGGYPLWLYGSLMLQYMYNFDDPYKISKSLLAMSLSDLTRTCQDRSGSHVIDCFLKSTTVELKHKSELVERLLGKYSDLACDKYGSRIVENIMNLSNEEVRATILRELSQNESLLVKNRNGWFVAKNTGLHHFKNRPSDWREVEHNRMKRKREFNDFIPSKHHRRSFGGTSSSASGDYHRRSFRGGSRGGRGGGRF